MPSYGLGTLPRFQEQEINVSDDLKIDIDHSSPLEQVVKATDSICQDESDKLSYTDTYFKVMTFTQKNKIKSGSIVKAKVIAVNNGKLQVKV